MFGGLHIEMAALTVGSLLQNSGRIRAPVEARVASSGTAESYLSALSVTRTRQAHQITACCLYKQRKAAFNSYSKDASQSPEDVLDFVEWCKKRRLKSQQFAFWDLVLAPELTILTLIFFIQRNRLLPVSCSAGGTFAPFLCRQQCELCTVAFNSPKRYHDHR